MDIQSFVSLLPAKLRDEVLVAVIEGQAAAAPAKPAAKRSSRKAFVAAKQAAKPAVKKPAAAKFAKVSDAKWRDTIAFPGLVGDVAASDGSLAAIAKALGIAKPKAAAALKRAVKEGLIHMAGERRFSRYGTSAEQAHQRSQAASVKPAKATAPKAAKPAKTKAHASLNGAAVVN